MATTTPPKPIAAPAGVKPSYVTTKYGTKIDVTGLNPEQTKKVLSVAQDKGAYGTKGAALAAQLKKQQTVTPTTGGKNTKPAPKPTIDPTGKIDLDVVYKNAPQLMGGNQTVQGLADESAKASYDFITRDYAQQQARDLEAKKQELAERGIPMSTNDNDLYNYQVNSVNRDWQNRYADANNQAIATRNQGIQAISGASTDAFNAFINSVKTASDSALTARGLTQDEAIKLKELANRLQIARIGASSGQSSGSDPIVNQGYAPGF